MKQFIEYIIYGLCVITLIVITTRVAITLTPNRFYENSAVVVELEDFETVVAEDSTGNLWAFNTANITAWHCGDTAIMLMDDNGTDEEVTDDYIVKVLRGE